MDMEDHLDLHFIRRNSEPDPKQTTSGTKIHEYLPLLLCDIQKATCALESNGVCRVFIGSNELHFRSCISYAVVLGKIRDNDSFYKYLIDDGTATMEISIFKSKGELQTINHLLLENSILLKRSNDEKQTKIYSSLDRLLSKTAEYLNGATIPIGGQILVHGRPQMYRGNMELNVFSFFKNNEISRDIEIGFKDYLIESYTKLKSCR